MKQKTYQLFIVLLVFVGFITACNDDDKAEITPSGITDIQTKQLPGEIEITWNNVEPITFKYLRINYFDHLTKKDVSVLASKYTESIIIPNTRAKFGDYKFSIQPFSETETGGEVFNVTAQSGIAPKTITVTGTKQLELTADGLFTDAQEPSEGPIKDLLDGNTNSYFHAAWSVDKGPMPHYIVVDLGKNVLGFKLSYTTRNHGGSGNHPKKITLYGSNEFDGSTFDPSTAIKLGELTDLPNGKAKSFTSENFILENAIRYLWVQVNETHGGTKYFALSELSVTELELKIIDPEAE